MINLNLKCSDKNQSKQILVTYRVIYKTLIKILASIRANKIQTYKQKKRSSKNNFGLFFRIIMFINYAFKCSVLFDLSNF